MTGHRRERQDSLLISLFASAVEKAAEAPVLRWRQGRGCHIEQRRDRGARRIVEKRSDQLLEGGAAGLLGLGGWEVNEPRPIVLARQQAALDHDVQQLAHARWAGRI